MAQCTQNADAEIKPRRLKCKYGGKEIDPGCGQGVTLTDVVGCQETVQQGEKTLIGFKLTFKERPSPEDMKETLTRFKVKFC